MKLTLILIFIAVIHTNKIQCMLSKPIHPSKDTQQRKLLSPSYTEIIQSTEIMQNLNHFQHTQSSDNKDPHEKLMERFAKNREMFEHAYGGTSWFTIRKNSILTITGLKQYNYQITKKKNN